MDCNSKTADRRAKQNEIWLSGVIVICIWGIFDLLVFNFGSFGALISKWPITRKRLVVERNGVKWGSRGQLLHAYEVPLTFECSRSFGGHSAHLS